MFSGLGIFVSERKVKAAARSMAQFYPVVRTIFKDGEVDDETVECATAFLYLGTARDIFGRVFAGRLARRLRTTLKHSDAARLRERLQRIEQYLGGGGTSEGASGDSAIAAVPGTPDAGAQRRLHAVIDALLAEAGLDHADCRSIGACAQPFELAARRIKTHLVGIKRQNFLLIGR